MTTNTTMAVLDRTALTDSREATVTMASPSWWGADSTRLRGALDGSPVLVKTYTSAAQEYLDIGAAASAACAAGEAGLAPAVVAVGASAAEIAFADLSETYRTATLADASPDLLLRLLRVRAAVGGLSPATVRTATVFDDIRSLLDRLRQTRVPLPRDTAFLCRVIDDAEARIHAVGFDRELRHGDGNLSNVLLARDGTEVLLVDWDWAAVIDPLQDLGAILVEVADDELHASEIFVAAQGHFDPRLFARALFYGYADHLRQALLGAWVDHCDPGTHEYSKYSDWQFLRARSALCGARADELLRTISR